jgi:hypothetical protein
VVGDRFNAQERARRLEAVVPVEFREKGRMRIKQQGRLINVSMTGFYVGFPYPPHLNEIVELWIPGEAWDRLAGKIRIRGQVRWWRADPNERALPRGFGVKILDFGSNDGRDRFRSGVARLEDFKIEEESVSVEAARVKSESESESETESESESESETETESESEG